MGTTMNDLWEIRQDAADDEAAARETLKAMGITDADTLDSLIRSAKDLAKVGYTVEYAAEQIAAALTPASDQIRRVAVKPSAKVVYDRLVEGPACAVDFWNDSHTNRYSARIKELRDVGVPIVKERCERHVHERFAWQYVLQPTNVIVEARK